MLEVHVVPVTWASHQDALRRIRQAVFVEEQKIPLELEFDSDDEQATHLLALNSAGTALGCARLLPNGLIGRVAVVANARGTGLGKALMDATVDEAQKRKLTRVFLHAQEDAEGFYRKLEFISTRARFKEAGIPHVTMERSLPIPFDTSGLKKSVVVRSTNALAKTTVREQRTSQLREFATESTAIEQLETVLSTARRHLRIYSPTLDHVLFDRAATVELISNFARSAPGVQVDILISDNSLIISRGHTLVELKRRLDQKMLIRKLPETVKADPQSWLVADNAALWVQAEPDEYRGWSDTFNPVQAERFAKRYTGLWERSVNDPELRVLQL